EQRAQREGRHRQQGGAVQPARQLACEVTVLDRIRRDRVQDSPVARIDERAAAERDQVVDVDPGPPLRAAPDATPETEAEEPRERRERAAPSREHEPDAQRGGAHTVAGRGAGLLLPCHAEIREEALAGGRRLLEPLVAAGAVVADGRGAHEGGWALAR